ETTVAALADYLVAFGYAVARGDAGMPIADYRSAAMVCADADRLAKLPLGARPARVPIVVAVTSLGDALADGVIDQGAADAAISRPLLRSEIEELLRRIAAGESPLQDRASGQRREAALPKFAGLRVLVADDSAVNREVAVEALSRLGAQVET